MRPSLFIFAVLAVLTLGASAWLANYAGMTGWPLSNFLDMTPIPKLMLVGEVMFCLPAVVLLGLTYLRGGRREATSRLLGLFCWLLLGPGLVGTVYGLLMVWLASSHTHVTRLMVLAPSLAESLLPFGVALVVATLGAAMNRPARPETV